MEFRNLDEFWGYYMGQHSKSATRRWHFAGTLSALVCFLFAALSGRLWLMMLCPVFGYGMAWYSHFFVEHNAPATFGHPIWSLFCDFKMFGLMLTGRLDREIKRLGKRPLMS